MKIIPKIKYTKPAKTPTPKLGGNIYTIWSNGFGLTCGYFLKIGAMAENINLGEIESTALPTPQRTQMWAQVEKQRKKKELGHAP
jgi:hypothetical protein